LTTTTSATSSINFHHQSRYRLHMMQTRKI
jgi:hypothetical protein